MLMLIRETSPGPSKPGADGTVARLAHGWGAVSSQTTDGRHHMLQQQGFGDHLRGQKQMACEQGCGHSIQLFAGSLPFSPKLALTSAHKALLAGGCMGELTSRAHNEAAYTPVQHSITRVDSMLNLYVLQCVGYESYRAGSCLSPPPLHGQILDTTRFHTLACVRPCPNHRTRHRMLHWLPQRAAEHQQASLHSPGADKHTPQPSHVRHQAPVCWHLPAASGWTPQPGRPRGSWSADGSARAAGLGAGSPARAAAAPAAPPPRCCSPWCSWPAHSAPHVRLGSKPGVSTKYRLGFEVSGSRHGRLAPGSATVRATLC